MNNLFSKTAVLLGLISAGLSACKKDEVRVSSEFGPAPTLTASTTAPLVLLQANEDAPALTYSWTPYSISLSDGSKAVSSIAYTVQLAKMGSDFGPASVKEFSGQTSTSTSVDIKTKDLNKALQDLGLPNGTASQVDVRLKTFVAGNIAPLYSATSTLTVTPYEYVASAGPCNQPDQAWGLIGPAGMGWDKDITMTYDCGTDTYTYTGQLNADKFKFRFNKAWDTNLGGTSSTGGDLTQGGPDLSITTAGVYTITLKPSIDAAKKASGSFTIKQ